MLMFFFTLLLSFAVLGLGATVYSFVRRPGPGHEARNVRTMPCLLSCPDTHINKEKSDEEIASHAGTDWVVACDGTTGQASRFRFLASQCIKLGVPMSFRCG
jgi:hypothetical protein